MSEMTPREIVSELDKHIIGGRGQAFCCYRPAKPLAPYAAMKSCVMKSRRKTF